MFIAHAFMIQRCQCAIPFNPFLQVYIDWRTERDRTIDLELFLSRLYASELQHISC